MDEGKLVILEQCYDMMHAHVLRGLLESNDIPCFLNGEHHNQMQPHLSIALGGIHVMVREDDLERAKALIASDAEEAPIAKRPLFQKPYLKTFLLTFAGFFVGVPALRAKGRHEQ